ncbi:MAG: hypothetical protein ABW006_04855 [Hyphomicrobium sp.]
MFSDAARTSSENSVVARFNDVPTWVWWLLALGYVGVRSWNISGAGAYGFFGDPDDATRLIQVRELMASWNWFDTTTMKVGGDAGMLSHWSRLVDLPIAVLIATFHLFMPIQDAERLTHAVWPIALFGGLTWVLFETATTVAGKTAGRLILLFAILSPLGWYQFAVGRIDHHNVMIASIISAIVLIWAYPQRTDVWRAAGVLVGLALAVGYEALAPAVVLGTLVAAWAVFDRRVERCAAGFSVALCSTFTAAFFATIPPSRWMDIRCDAISLNMVALVACGTAGLLIAVGPGRNWPIRSRIASIAVCAVAGIAIFGLLEPKCLAGPKGQLPPLVLEIWLNKVAENTSIVAAFFKRDFSQSFGLLLFYGIALAAQFYCLRTSRSAQDIFLFAMLAAIVGLACWQFKFTSYASFLCLVPMAVALGRLGPVGEISAMTVRLAAVVFLNQTMMIWMSGGVNALAGAPPNMTPQMLEDARVCSMPETVRELAELPAGLIASHIDVGAFIAANTHHRVLAAPYHRIANAIVANYQIFSARDPRSAAAILKREDVDYVAICRGLDTADATSPDWNGTLKADLIASKPPGYLVPVVLANANAKYRVWKVDRAALNLQLSKAEASAP